ncbi:MULTISPECIES: restriction endonuclease subunit S [Bacillus]|uniref:restriction endonuclease subunit S n=1 Tax=Bacillus TaxID=1386 RepID=UPI001454DA6F|nr:MULTISPECIES: restriction endonuclease subunit S [Bacillus]MDA4081885.1 restriction endonuclease subunit S [Bacillus cereus]
MKSNYKRIGDYIQEVNVRNTNLNVSNLLGINIDKFFMPSVANTVGTDMTKYKIVKNGQFACNRMHVGRDKRLPVALSKQVDDIIVSPAYNVFEVTDKEALDPEYLMMWFLREEFDRNAWFYTDADVRGGLDWKGFCNMQLPIPTISKQRAIVKEYNVLIDRINLNNHTIQKLEETAQAIYKQWFVDFEFPDENGNPYKSNGGQMEFNDELDKEIPKGWEVSTLKEFGKVVTGKTPSSESPEHFGDEMPFVTPGDFKKYNKFVIGAERNLSKDGFNSLKNKILKKGSVIVTCIGSDMGKVVLSSGECITNQQMNSIVVNQEFYSDYLYYYLKSIVTELKSIAMGGSTMPIISKSEFERINIIKPKDGVLEKFDNLLKPINEYNFTNSKISNALLDLKGLLLSKLATMEDNQ